MKTAYTTPACDFINFCASDIICSSWCRCDEYDCGTDTGFIT